MLTLATRLERISILTRTLLLMSTSAVVILAIDRLIPAPPRGNLVPVPFSELVRQMRLQDESTQDLGPPPAPGGPRGPPDRVEPFDDGRPPPGPPPPDDQRGNGTVRSAPNEPKPMIREWIRSAALESLLAERLEVDSATLRVFAAAADSTAVHRDLGELRFTQGVMAARLLPNGRWRIFESRPLPGTPLWQQRWPKVLLLALLTLGPLGLIFARSLVLPLRRFAAAAQRAGPDAGAAALPREGPVEMLVAIDAFNAMQSRLNLLVQERTRLVGAIAHDLRTPLTRLAFRLDDLPAPLGEKVRGDIEEMKSMISAALDFIRDRSRAGPPEPLDFRLLVERVVDDQGDLGHEVSLSEGDPITMKGVPLELRRMVSNLVENAVKYGARARLRLHAHERHCILEVDDDGPGIPETLQQQVFEPFYRVEASRSRETGGIGLGLSAVSAIVLEHGGEIRLGNRHGGGLRVTVSLPLAHH